MAVSLMHCTRGRHVEFTNGRGLAMRALVRIVGVLILTL